MFISCCRVCTLRILASSLSVHGHAWSLSSFLFKNGASGPDSMAEMRKLIADEVRYTPQEWISSCKGMGWMNE
jgi:hypothetical protein